MLLIGCFIWSSPSIIFHLLDFSKETCVTISWTACGFFSAARRYLWPRIVIYSRASLFTAVHRYLRPRVIIYSRALLFTAPRRYLQNPALLTFSRVQSNRHSQRYHSQCRIRDCGGRAPVHILMWGPFSRVGGSENLYIKWSTATQIFGILEYQNRRSSHAIGHTKRQGGHQKHTRICRKAM